VTLLLHSCYTVVKRWLHCCYTVVTWLWCNRSRGTLLLHSCYTDLVVVQQVQGHEGHTALGGQFWRRLTVCVCVCVFERVCVCVCVCGVCVCVCVWRRFSALTMVLQRSHGSGVTSNGYGVTSNGYSVIEQLRLEENFGTDCGVTSDGYGERE
jgi:hypothetical protein